MPESLFAQARATAEIDSAALAHNYKTLHHTCGKTIAVVKAEAYGHGLALTVPALLDAGCKLFAVATAKEALTLRKLAPFSGILLLGYAETGEISPLLDADITLCAFSLPYAKALCAQAGKCGKKARVHLKIDSGMCRLGFLPEQKSEILEVLALPHLDVCGIFTHFPSADTDREATLAALARFNALRAALPVPLFAHASASAAALSIPASRPDAVRTGIALYGYPPVQTALDLRPVMRLTAPVVRLCRVPSGTRVGYGGDFRCPRESLIGTVPLGYADGIFRSLSGYPVTVSCGGHAFSAPIVGRVCMDYLMLDLTDIPAKEGETVCFLEDFAAMARHAGTIPYELLTAVSARVPRRGKGEL